MNLYEDGDGVYVTVGKDVIHIIGEDVVGFLTQNAQGFSLDIDEVHMDVPNDNLESILNTVVSFVGVNDENFNKVKNQLAFALAHMKWLDNTLQK